MAVTTESASTRARAAARALATLGRGAKDAALEQIALAIERDSAAIDDVPVDALRRKTEDLRPERARIPEIHPVRRRRRDDHHVARGTRRVRMNELHECIVHGEAPSVDCDGISIDLERQLCGHARRHAVFGGAADEEQRVASLEVCGYLVVMKNARHLVLP